MNKSTATSALTAAGHKPMTLVTHGNRFQRLAQNHLPVLVLDEEGTIQHCTPAARRLLEFRSSQHLDPCFFAHVHGKNLYRVMRDVADIVCHGKTRASWLIRIRTGQGRWRWYKVAVRKHVENPVTAITVRLHDLHEW